MPVVQSTDIVRLIWSIVTKLSLTFHQLIILIQAKVIFMFDAAPRY